MRSECRSRGGEQVLHPNGYEGDGDHKRGRQPSHCVVRASVSNVAAGFDLAPPVWLAPKVAVAVCSN